MANPTTNFGWVMPTSTDLVTDLPADFAIFGQAVDTSMADLKGGTTGQVLSKTSNTDMDFTWVAQDDSNAIQNAIVDAKGDIITATAADTPARLAVGTNGQTLVADSTASTGLKWATASTPSFVGCRVTNVADQSIANATRTVVTFDTETFDTNAFHDTSTNTGRMTIPAGKAGKYLVTAGVTFGPSGASYREIYLFKNGSFYSQVFPAPSGTGSSGAVLADLVDLAVADYLEIRVEQGTGGALAVRGSAWGTGSTYFGITYLGA